MKIKTGFVLREVAGNFVVVAVGEATKKFNGIINLNSTGAFLWKKLLENTTAENLSEALMNEYGIDIKTAKNDVDGFISKLKGADLLE